MNTNKTNGVPVAVEYRNGQERVNARELHAALGVETKFADWISRRIEQYHFTEGEDYSSFLKNEKRDIGSTTSKEYSLTLDMAKELALVENNERGKAIRKYLLAVEKDYREMAEQFITLESAVKPMELMNRIYGLFSTDKALGLQQIYHLVDLSLAKSGITEEYLAAADVARAVIGATKIKGASEHTLSMKVAQIRQVVEQAGALPSFTRNGGGFYSISSDEPERAGFPLELPERKTEASLPFEEAEPERAGFPLRLPAKAAANV